MMRRAISAFLAMMLLFGATHAEAAEKGLIIRAGDLMAQPFIDAAKTSAVTPNQPVTILERRGAWANVESNGKNGWVRLLNIRLEPRPGSAAQPSSSGSAFNPASLLRTGSSGKTVTTGVKGMDEEDIRNATPNYAELELLDGLAANAADARANAQKSGLKESAVDYLDKGRRK